MPDQGNDVTARQFAESFMDFMQWLRRTAPPGRGEVTALIATVLGTEGAAQSVVTREFAPLEHVNLQTALNSWIDQPRRQVEIHGLARPPHFGSVTLQQLVSSDYLPPLRLSAPALADLPNGPSTTLACLQLALLIVTDERGRYVILVQAPNEDTESLCVEVAGLPVDGAQQVLSELDGLRDRLNVYRGRWLDVIVSDRGSVRLGFVTDTAPTRDEVVLPDSVLERLERHTFGIAEHRAALRAAGQHLKRGILLFGPPGTGKTHSTRYLLGRMDGYTRLTLTGRSLHVIGSVAELARELQPSMVVLEDVDLVAEDRSFGPGDNPVLFDLLDAMDGAAGDADLAFLLTTNRADLLEPALAARPGRVDVAVEIALPDDAARGRLLDLYGSRVPLQLSDADTAEAISRTDGVTASFLKELVRRAVLESLRSGESSGSPAVTGGHVRAALDELLDGAHAVTRTLLGAGEQEGDEPAAPTAYRPWPRPGLATRGRSAAWFAYGPHRHP